MEILEYMLHYAWQHRMFPLHPLQSAGGCRLEIVNVGKHNSDSGPDFQGAQIRIDGVLWVGNVEIHLHSSDWYQHQHETDPAYDNVILHVVAKVDREVQTSSGRTVEQFQLDIPEHVIQNYTYLTQSDKIPRCRQFLSSISSLSVTSWLSALYIERLEQRTDLIMERRKQCEKDWEHTAFVTIARNFGFGKNGDAFERWAYSIPMTAISKHRNDLFQIEAIFFGQAGLLNEDPDTPGYTSRQEPLSDYYQQLKREYNYLSKKFSLRPINAQLWRFMRMRPQNFPHIRIAQLAVLYCSGVLNLSRILNAESIESLQQILSTHVSDYWKTHYSFVAVESAEKGKTLSKESKNRIIMNSIVPLFFAYGKYKADETLCTRAIDLMEQLQPEKNHIIADWEEAGITCHHAADSQALIQLTSRYCEAKDCLRCRFGYEYIRHTPDYLKESEK